MILFDRVRLVDFERGHAPLAAVAVREGKIAGVFERDERVAGAALPARPAPAAAGARDAERTIDCRGLYLYPAFHDAHVHLTQTGLSLSRVPLGAARSRDDLLDRMREALRAPREEPALVGEGADESSWADARLPEREDLDRVSRDVPLIVKRVCLHKAVANSAALALLPLASPQIDRATGILLEEAAMSLDAKVLAPHPAHRVAAIERGARLALSRGVTRVGEITSWPSVLAAVDLAEAGRLPIRMTLHILYEDLARAKERGWQTGCTLGAGERLEIGGIKLFMDGSIGARTAWLREPYRDAPSSRGLALLSCDQLAARVREIEDAGFRALVHVIGDAALDAALDGFEGAGVRRGNTRGHRLEHVEIVPDARALDRLAGSGLAVVAQPNFIANWGRWGGLYEARLGRARVEAMNRFASLIGAGVPLAFSSDAMPIDPLLGVRAAVTHPVEGERLSASEAFARYTHWGERIAQGSSVARAASWPRLGDPADFILLSGTPEEVAAGGDAAPLATVLAGEIVHDVCGIVAGARA